MNVIFWGTPDFAVPSLQKIVSSQHKVTAVVTVPDKQQGRGLKVQSSAVKVFAESKGIPVLQPESLTDEAFLNTLRVLHADIFVVVAFKILPPVIFEMPEFGSFNLHASLLPKYRGAAPIQWAIINGEIETGVTTFKLAQKVDTGNVYLQRKLLLNELDNFGTLHDKLSIIGAEAVLATLNEIESGNAVLQTQNNTLATPAPKITKEICQIDWKKPAHAVNNLIRGLAPAPGAFFIHRETQYKVFQAHPVFDMKLQPGEIKTNGTEIFIGCGKGSLQILGLQKEGRKKLSAEEFLRGHSF